MKSIRIHIAEIDDFSESVLLDMSEKYTLTTGLVIDLKETLLEVDVFWFRLGYTIDKTVLTSQSRCKVLATPVTGIDHIDEQLCRDLGVEILCLRGESEFLKEVRATAEHTLLITMMLMRKAYKAVAHTQDSKWNRDLFRGNELYYKKVGILGYGRLGAIVADYFEALSCKVFYYDIKPVVAKESHIQCESAEDLVSQVDIVSIHLPYNKGTHHIYSDRFFEVFTGDQWLINTSRGGLIEEESLLNALLDGRLKGAAVDVLEGEPEIKNHLLIDYAKKLDNLIITPHIGGNTHESFEKTERFIADKIINHIEVRGKV